MSEFDRPEWCCGACPPLESGGYDCTCEGNPRCDGPRRKVRKYNPRMPTQEERDRVRAALTGEKKITVELTPEQLQVMLDALIAYTGDETERDRARAMQDKVRRLAERGPSD